MNDFVVFLLCFSLRLLLDGCLLIVLLFAVFRYVWFYCLFVEICFCLCWVCVYAGCLSLVGFVVLMFCFCLLLVLQVLPGLILAEFACYLVVLLPVIIVVIWHDCGVSSL